MSLEFGWDKDTWQQLCTFMLHVVYVTLCNKDSLSLTRNLMRVEEKD